MGPVFLLGCIYPDLVRGPLLMLNNALRMGDKYPFVVMSFGVLHSPIPLLVQAWLLAQFFEESIRLRILLNLLAGITLHLLLDAGQRAYHISYLWLFPFSFENPIRGLWWADQGVFLTIGFMAAAIVVYLVRRNRGRQGP